jgi:glutamate decarboxylase
MPVVAVRLRSSASGLTLTALAENLRRKGWIAPVYHLPANVEDVEVMRFVVKPEFTRAEAEALLRDLQAAVAELTAAPRRSAFNQWVNAVRRRYAMPTAEVWS